MYRWTLILLLFISETVFSQGKGETQQSLDKFMPKTTSHFNAGKIADPKKLAAVKEFVIGLTPSLKREHVSIELLHFIESPQGFHYTLIQQFKGVRIYGTQIKVNLSKTGKVLSLFDGTVMFNQALNGSGLNGLAEQIYWFDGTDLHLCNYLESAPSSNLHYETVWNDNGIYSKKDLMCYSNDSLVNVDVFLPDPLTTAGTIYGAPYVDNSDADAQELLDEIVTTTTTATFDTDTFWLRSNYVEIREHSDPITAPTYSITSDFSYTRSQQEFEDVNVFYHIHTFQEYIQSLGFTNLASYPIHVDAHGFNNADFSAFNSGFNPPRLTFGEGGVDDAEDADIIIHEYGHAISYAAAPGTLSGSEREGLEEGIGDYLAASYSRFLNPHNWWNVFSWDGHNQFWGGRTCTSNKNYPADLTGNEYSDGEIWSTALMVIWGNIGRQETDKLLFESMYSYAAGMSMTDAAMLFIQADSLCYGGIHYNDICAAFDESGILHCILDEVSENKKPLARLINSVDFGSNATYLEFEKSTRGTITLYQMDGKLVNSYSFSGQQIPISGLSTSTGLYMLHVRTTHGHAIFKLVR
jgi:hypothetical protein